MAMWNSPSIRSHSVPVSPSNMRLMWPAYSSNPATSCRARLNTRAAPASSSRAIWNTSRKAVTSSRVTIPSALAIFAPSAITAMVKATLRSGGLRSLSNTALSPSPLARADTASDMRVQIDMRGTLAPLAGLVSAPLKKFLHQDQIQPTAKLPAHLRQYSHLRISKTIMKRDAAGVLPADPGNHRMHARRARMILKRLHQHPTHTAPPRIGGQHDGMLRRAPISGPAAELFVAGKAQQTARLFHDHETMPIGAGVPDLVNNILQGLFP